MRSLKQIILAILVGLTATACRTNLNPDAARIHKQTSSDLVAWLGRERMPEDLKDRDAFFEEAVSAELIHRNEVGFLLASLSTSKNETARKHLISDVLYCLNDHRVYDAFAQRLDDKENEEGYYVAFYLAKRGNIAALATLNRHYFQYPVSSLEWSYTAELFGRFKYRPAAGNLTESLDAASLNLSVAACDALQKIYPDSPKDFKGPSEAKNYFTKKLNGGQDAGVN